ncbi:ATP synthase subunit s, mitochondrial [Adelges cooleyi]|uniref:ATP synthase subunit s, mitochondrial n=1 Tax=Adelges cooleyi TaxID=133065 RepID=UPI00217FF1EC|nr:ATP synthase subunit s, mitochondrial [Adelges cooleyi]
MLKTLINSSTKRVMYNNHRYLWKWVEDTFNRVEEDRIKEIGPNMACAEWLMKNGAQIRWKGCKEFVNHYNCLPAATNGSLQQFKIEQVYAGKEASISHVGFNYFKGCKHISTVSFVGCNTIENKALSNLNLLAECLEHLEVIGCVNVTDNGILALKDLQALKTLVLKNLQYFTKTEVISQLKDALPNCKIKHDK